MTPLPPQPPSEDSVRAHAYANYVETKEWTKPFTYSADEAEAFAAEFGTERLDGKALLEIGFGQGNLLAWARDRGARLSGTEINESCIAHARQEGVELIDSDLASAAAGRANAFDYIAAFDVFEHMPLGGVAAALDACALMLKPGGRLILRFPNGQSPFGLAPQHGDVTHITALSAVKLEQMIPGTGLAIVASRPAHRILGPSLPRRLKRMVRYFFQKAIDRFFGFVYATDITLAPVVVVVLEKRTTAA